MQFLPLLLKTAGFRRGGPKRKSGRSKRWSRSAQTIFASWAVLGQLGGMSLLVAEVIEPKLARAQITTIPGARGGANGTATSTGFGAFAIGISATANGIGAQASGYLAYANGQGAQASGYFANASGLGAKASG